MENKDDSANLEGKGWDILAGGEQHAKQAGGDDPFDAEDASSASGENPFDEPVGASLTTGGDNPFGDDASAEMLEGPQDAYGDWGRGGDDPIQGRRPTPSTAPEPRDLSAKELGYGTDTGPLTAPSSASATPPPPRDLSPDDPIFSGSASATSPADEIILGSEPKVSSGGEAPPKRLVSTSGGAAGKALSAGVEVAGTTESTSGTSQVPEQARFAAEKQSVLETQFEIYDPFAGAGEPPILNPDPNADLALDPGLGKALVTPERIDALWDEINEVYSEVIHHVRGHFGSTEKMLAELKRARELLMSGVENYDNAEVMVKKVRARLEREGKVRLWSRTIGSWIAVYLVAWLIALLLLVLIQRPVLDFFEELIPAEFATAYIPALWGGLGGVLGGLWVLIEHTARKRDFDPIHTRWYVLNPFMGMGLGVVVYALFQMGVILGGAGAGQPAVATQTTAIEAGNAWLLYGTCLVVGFQQNVVWDLLDRVLQVIRPSKNDKGPTTEVGSGLEFQQ